MALLFLGVPAVCAASVLLALCSPGRADAATMYSIVDLGAGFVPVAINNAGQVLTPTGVYENGVTKVLPQPAGGVFTPRAINNLGQVAGYVNYSGEYQYDLAIYSHGALTISNTVTGVDPAAINDAGQIAGDAVFLYKTFFYSGGLLTITGTAPNVLETAVRGMNAQGEVVGLLERTGVPGQQAFAYLNGNLTELAIPAATYVANAINDLGDITGFFGLHANSGLTAGVFLYSGNRFYSLGPAVGGAFEEDNPLAINNAGVIVGAAEVAGYPPLIAWAYFPGSGFVNLNSVVPPNSGWVLECAQGINNNGQIIGYGMLNSQQHAFLLTPAERAPVGKVYRRL